MNKNLKKVYIFISPFCESNRFPVETRPRLKHISRVGIGLDSVDLLAAKKRYFGFLRPRYTSFSRGGTCHRSDDFTSSKDRSIQPHDALGTIEPLHGAPDLRNHYWNHGGGRDRGKNTSAAKGLRCPQGSRQCPAGGPIAKQSHSRIEARIGRERGNLA